MCPSVCSYVYPSVGLCVGGSASDTGCSRLQYFPVLHPEWAQYYSSLRLLQVLLHSMPGGIHDPTYPEILWHLHIVGTVGIQVHVIL